MSRVHISALILSVWSLHALQRLVWVLLRVVCFPPTVHPHVDQVDWDYVRARASLPHQTLTVCPGHSLTSSHPILPHVRIHASTQACFCCCWFKISILSIKGIFFLQCFRVLAALSDLFTSWFNTAALRARSQLGPRGGPESLVNLEILRSWLSRDYQTWESAANEHWVKTRTGSPVKTTGAQSLNLAPHTEQ